MLRFNVAVFFAALTILALSGAAMADKESIIELKTVAELEVEAINEDGEKEIQRVEAAKVVPGDEVIYTIHNANKGEQPAENVVITDPIPEHMLYLAGSASGEGTAITFSVDDGKNFDKPEKLMVAGAEGKSRPAVASDYTHVRWSLGSSLFPNVDWPSQTPPDDPDISLWPHKWPCFPVRYPCHTAALTRPRLCRRLPGSSD